MTDPDLSRTLRRMAEELRLRLQYQIKTGDAGPSIGLYSYLGDKSVDAIEQFAHAVAAAVRQELEPYLQHKPECFYSLHILTDGTVKEFGKDCTCGLATLRSQEIPTLPPHVRDCKVCRIENGCWLPCKKHQPHPASQEIP